MSESSLLPRITMVVPSFRAVKTIGRTLDSIIAEKYPNLQLIVMDGASDDGTVDVVKSYAAHIEHWVSEKDECQADALNKGFAVGDGELFGWLCADDSLAPGALSKMASYLVEHPECDLVTGGCKRVFDDGREVITEPAEDFFERLDHMNTIEQPSTLWRASAHHRAGVLDLSYKYAFDWEWWCRMKRTGSVFERISAPLSVYYFSDSNLTSSGGTKIADEMYRVIKQYGPHNGRIADIYRFLYQVFDLRGFYDADAGERIPAWKRRGFHMVLKALYRVYGKALVDAYNWNFASRQQRGLGWQ